MAEAAVGPDQHGVAISALGPDPAPASITVLRADNAILSVADLAALQDTADTLTQAEWAAVPQVIPAARLAALAGHLGCEAQLLQMLRGNGHAPSRSVQLRVTV